MIVSREFAFSFADNPDDPILSSCSTFVYVKARGQIVCQDNGIVVADRVPSLLADDNIVRYNDKPIARRQNYYRRVTSLKLITTHDDIPPKLASKIIEMYKAGVPIKQIQEKLGVSAKTIYNIVSMNCQLRRGKYRSSRRLTKEEIEAILNDIRNGMSIYKVAKKYGRSYNTIKRIVFKYMSKQDLVLFLWFCGWCVSRICSVLGVSRGFVYSVLESWVQSRSSRRRSYRRVSEGEVARIVSLYRSGRSIHSIARELGRSPSVVYYVLRREGLK